MREGSKSNERGSVNQYRPVANLGNGNAAFNQKKSMQRRLSLIQNLSEHKIQQMLGFQNNGIVSGVNKS